MTGVGHHRVLAAAPMERGDETNSAEHLGPIVPVAFVFLHEEMRADATEITAFFQFKRQVFLCSRCQTVMPLLHNTFK